MKKQEILEKIELHTFRIQQIIVRMVNTPSEEDIKRLNEECRHLYELSVLLKHTGDFSPAEPSKTLPNIEPPVIITASAPQPVVPEVPTVSPTPTENSIKKEESQPVPPAPTPIDKNLNAEPVTPTSAKTEKTNQPKITYIDIQSDDVKEGLIDKFINQKIDDLKKAIALHEKFNFINELFSGKNEEYQHFIDQINQASTYQEAKKILEEYMKKHNWEEESKVFLKLLQLIQRRHS